MIGIRWVWQPPRDLWDANFSWQPAPCIEQDNALEPVGAVETKLRRIKAMMPLLGAQGLPAGGMNSALCREISTEVFMHMIIFAAGRKACEQVLDTATPAPRAARGMGFRTRPLWPRPLHHSRNCRPCPNRSAIASA
jgi:hypothetical protein